MRKFLLASVATLGTGGLMGAAFAQVPPAVVGAPLQGQAAFPMANPTAYVNNNNNYQAPALPQPLRLFSAIRARARIAEKSPSGRSWACSWRDIARGISAALGFRR